MPLPKIVSGPAYSAYESQLEKEVLSGLIPQHIAFIMDGNRRYAKEVLNKLPMEFAVEAQRLLEISLENTSSVG